MKKIDWNNFNTDEEALNTLKTLPRYNNTPIKSLYWRIYFFLKLVYCRLLNLTKPIYMVLVTNNSCNLNCTYCYGHYGERKNPDYSTLELLKIIDELKSMGTCLLTVHGGESLLRKDIGEILNYAKLKGFYISMNTNGYLVPHKINELKCLDAVCLSLDGREENNDKHRGAGCFNKVMEAIEILKKHKTTIIISATLNKDTANDIEYLAKLGQEMKFRVQYHILYNSKNLEESTLADITMSDEEIRTATGKILELKKAGLPIFWSENVIQTALNWPENYETKFYFEENETPKSKSKSLIPCYHGKLKFQLDADGRIVTCWAHNNEDAPNIKELGVKGAIQKCAKEDTCKHCSFLANNEHNALMSLNPKNILRIAKMQLIDAIKIRKRG